MQSKEYGIRWSALLSSIFICSLLAVTAPVMAQESDTTATEDEFDFSQFEDLDFVDEAATRYASSKISKLSPAQLVSFGYDVQGGFDLEASQIINQDGTINSFPETITVNAVHGVNLGANIPVLSKNSIIIQASFLYRESRFEVEQSNPSNDFNNLLANYTHRRTGIGTTIFKPFNETNFAILQAQADLSGDYGLPDFQPLKYTRYSVAGLYGWRVNDRKMFAVGLSRTYRVGEQNIVPIVLFNWTNPTQTWGAEILAPARGHVRKNINPRSIAMFGYRLRGQSYRLNNSGLATWDFDNLELRRGELRIGPEYYRQIKGFIWVGIQAGLRYNWSFEVDHVPNGEDFFRGFFGDQAYVMENEVGNPWFVNISFNLVSP